MQTCPCDEDPLTPQFYMVKFGFTGEYIILLFLLQNIDCGYSLERRGGSNVYPQSMFLEKIIKIIKENYLKIIIFTAFKISG